MGSGTIFLRFFRVGQKEVSIPSRDLWGLALAGEFTSFHFACVSIPSRDLWGLALSSRSLFNSSAGGFNPFQGFMGSGTERHRGRWSRVINVSIPSRDLWGLAPLVISVHINAGGGFQSLPGIYGVWHRIPDPASPMLTDSFNPFQGFMGSGTSGPGERPASPYQFQSLPGIYGVWHLSPDKPISAFIGVSIPSRDLWGLARRAAGHPGLLPGPVSIPSRDLWGLAQELKGRSNLHIPKFQSLPGIYGVWHVKDVATTLGIVTVSIPSRDLWGLAPIIGALAAKSVEGFNPFQGFMGSGTDRPARLWQREIYVSIPSRDLWGLARSDWLSGRHRQLSFNPFQGFMGSGTFHRGIRD